MKGWRNIDKYSKQSGISSTASVTLARLYNNHEVFEGEVKIRKGEAVQIIMDVTDFEAVLKIFLKYMGQLEAKINDHCDPNAKRLRGYLDLAKEKVHQCQVTTLTSKASH